MRKIEQIVGNLSRYMLGYTLLVIILGTFVSYVSPVDFLSRYIMVIVFLMIYPMMVNVSFKGIKRISKCHKTIAIALFFNFLIAPFLYWLLCTVFHVSPDIKIALLILSIAPASSMGLGYVGLSEGDMVSASTIVALAFLLSLIVYPLFFHLLNLGYFVAVPFSTIIKSLIFVLVLPLVLGLITREYIIERKNINFKEVKPYFSLTTLIFLYILIFVIFALKGHLIIENWAKVVVITPVVISFYAVMIFLAFIFDKYLVKLTYEDHQAVVFTTVSKNVALTIGLLATIFGKKGYVVAMYPAIVSIFQIIFLMIYLHFSREIRKWWAT